MNSDTDILGEHLYIEDLFPLEWEQAGDHSAAGIAGLDSSENEVALRQVIDLGELSWEMKEENRHQSDNARLEQKLNLLIDLVGNVIEMNRKSLDKKQVRISSMGVEWLETGSAGISPGDMISLRIYLHPYAIRPVQLTGKVADAKIQASGTLYRLAYTQLPEVERELLEKLIFRHHRRKIASMKG